MKLKALYLISKTKLKYWNLKKWKNYLEFTKNPKNYRGCAPLSIGSIENIFPAKYKDLFQDLPEYQELINKYHIPEIFHLP